jgi:hypothetical protein
MGASTWNPQGLSRPVMGSLYLFTLILREMFQTNLAEKIKTLILF